MIKWQNNWCTFDILALIADYQQLAKVAIDAMQRAFGRTDLLRAWRDGTIKHSGELTAPKITYEFHGIGCRFEIGKQLVDVDFGPDGRYDGFDAWRLWLFADSVPAYRGIGRPAIELEVNLLKELEREIAMLAHPLHNKNCQIIGYRKDNRFPKDLILSLPERQFAHVHLTWNKETDAQWPSCQIFDSEGSLNNFLCDQK